MKLPLSVIATCFLFLSNGLFGQEAERMVLSGVYQGSDLYVQNPFSGQGVSFCVFEVRVNDEITSDEVNSSAFVIDMEVMGLKPGDDVEILISHKKECAPRVLNPEVLKPRSTAEIQDMSVSDDNILTWSTVGEAGSLPFYVEQFRWNKWVKAGEVMGVGKPQKQSYEFKLTPHSGLNKVRVRQLDHRDESVSSPILEFQGPEDPVTYGPEKVREKISFTRETKYEIFDVYGNLVMQGYDKEVDVNALEKGEYYLNYDRSFGETFKKR